MDNILTHSEEKHQGAREKEDLQNSTNKKTDSDIPFAHPVLSHRMGGLEDLFYAYSFPPFDGRTLAMGIVLVSTGLNCAKSANPLNRPGNI
jgi:hypothetical protein